VIWRRIGDSVAPGEGFRHCFAGGDDSLWRQNYSFTGETP